MQDYYQPSQESEDHWVSFTDIMMAFALVLLLMLTSLVIIAPDDPIDVIIKEGQDEILKAVEAELSVGNVTYQHRIDGHRQIISFGTEILFDSGEYELSPNGLRTLDIFAAVLNRYQNVVFDEVKESGYFTQISIDGHTDSVPISPGSILARKGVLTNWHLSSLRAISVLRHFEDQRILRNIMTPTGYADTKPASNDNSENRRVEITLLYSPEIIRAKVTASVNARQEEVEP